MSAACCTVKDNITSHPQLTVGAIKGATEQAAGTDERDTEQKPEPGIEQADLPEKIEGLAAVIPDVESA